MEDKILECQDCGTVTKLSELRLYSDNTRTCPVCDSIYSAGGFVIPWPSNWKELQDWEV